MKKWLSVILALVLVLALVACGSKNDDNITDTKSENSGSAVLDDDKIDDGEADPVQEAADQIHDQEMIPDNEEGEAEELTPEKKEDPDVSPEQDSVDNASVGEGSLADLDSEFEAEDDSEDIDVDGEFTELESGDEEVIVLDEGEAIGGF